MLKKLVAYILLERPVKKKSLGEIATKLEKAGDKLSAQMANWQETDHNRKVLRHVIGIERWGQNRLRTGLGEPLKIDEYDDYRPDRDAPWEDYIAAFKETRQQTVSLINDFQEAGVDTGQKIPHNSFGNISLKAWLRYLNTHANLELKKIK